ncbi:MAG TPA: GIY-YIG nuclease family protein [Cyclobacteriaceae bacterium]|jgi:group I intron endonuclease|nr:GIY-YIG nuclease family protein [Cyclobacteriaceae bacterium]
MDLPTSGGVYAILNMVTRDFYIGSAKNFLDRKNRHFKYLKAGNHQNYKLQQAYNEYGEEAFRMKVLENVEDLSLLLSREQYWMDKYRPTYNLRVIAESNLGMKYSPETKKRMSEAAKRTAQKVSQEFKDERNRKFGEVGRNNFLKLNASRKGKPLTEKQEQQLENARLAKEEKGTSDETRKKLSESTRKSWDKRRQKKLEQQQNDEPAAD